MPNYTYGRYGEVVGVEVLPGDYAASAQGSAAIAASNNLQDAVRSLSEVEAAIGSGMASPQAGALASEKVTTALLSYSAATSIKAASPYNPPSLSSEQEVIYSQTGIFVGGEGRVTTPSQKEKIGGNDSTVAGDAKGIPLWIPAAAVLLWLLL